jgi:hypothetical protein
MKRSVLLPWTLLVLYIAAHWTWSSGLLVGLKYQHGYATKNDALILEALDQDEKGTDFIVLLHLAEERMSLVERQCQHVLELANQMVAEHPKDPNPLVLRARVLKAGGRLHSAIEDMRAAKRLIESGESKTEYADTPGVERVAELLKLYEDRLNPPK